MLVKFAKESYTIAAGGAVSGKVSHPQMIQIAGGRVWLTVAGDSADHWLNAGEVFTLPAGRLIVIEADQETSEIQFKNNNASFSGTKNLPALSTPASVAPCQASLI